jgi:hypothetical protein
MVLKEPKLSYSELEVAAELGISVQELRTLISSHIVKNDAELSSIPVETFSSSDLLLLRILANSAPAPLSA